MSRSKVKVLFHSNHSKFCTGFGKNMRNILLSLYEDEEIEVYEAANGIRYDTDIKTPWKCYGTYPSDLNTLKQIHGNAFKKRAAGYGYYCIDKIIDEVKPDVYVGIEDIWAFKNFENKDWWNKTKKIIWTTIDSLPILSEAVDMYNSCDKTLVWASFAEKEMKRIGCQKVETLHGAINYESFKPIKKRKNLRDKFGLSDNFVIGFVFKNQLRKSVPNLLEGFKLFKQQNPNAKGKLLLHTGWLKDGRNWDIESYIKEKSLDKSDVLCTYHCQNCLEYKISEYKGEETDCNLCGTKKSLKTKSSTKGVSEKQLNEIYNLMDVYCHPFTSGGQELPIQEAKSAGLSALVTDYSCGEDSAYEHQGGLPLSWSEYREPSTQFIKASTCPKSISDNLKKVFLMGEEEKQKILKNGRTNIKENFSTSTTITRLKKIILDTKKLKTKEPKKKNESSKENNPIKIEDLLGDEGPKKRILVTMPESAGDVLMVNSLIENIKETYPDKNIYVSTKNEFHSMINDNPFVYKIIPYSTKFDDSLFLEGFGKESGFFEIAFLAHIPTQRKIQYIHNGSDKIQFFKK